MNVHDQRRHGRPEDIRADKTRPFTGAEYMESLRDGREVYINGERVADVTAHPAMRNSVRSLARMYDALHDEKTKGRLTSPTDTGNGGYTHKYFRVAKSSEELVAQQGAIADWARMSYGWMGRTGGADEHARCQCRLVRTVQGQCAGLAQAGAGIRPLHEPCDRQPADRPPQAR
jgi:hypothetical protein